MKQQIKKIFICSNNIAYGPEPLPTDEVEQHLTISKSGEVTLKAYNYIRGFSNVKVNREMKTCIGEEATQMIFSLVDKWTDIGLDTYATDVGSWNMSITDEQNKTYKYYGPLIDDLVVDNIRISAFLRKCINIPDLFLFDGGEIEAGNVLKQKHHLQREEAEVVVSEFLKLYKEYKIEKYSNNCNELVVVIADSMVFYIKYNVICNFMCFEDNRAEYLANGTCGIDIEELTPNTNLPKYVHTTFMQSLEEKLGIFTTWIRYGRFRGINQKYLANGLMSQASYVMKNYPDVKLKERWDAWSGEAFNIVILEMTDVEGNIAYAADAIKGSVHPFVLRVAKRLLSQPYGYSNVMGFGLSEFYHIIDKSFVEAFRSHKGTRLVARLQENLKYFSFGPIYIKQEKDIRETVQKYLSDVKNGIYDAIERISYSKPEYKWKTEEYVYKIVKKFYKDYGVIYQYRPFFLHSSLGGQMSYDIFISGLNIAIEYQGKQHFEAIDYFGGEEAFRKVQQRDREKHKLSRENGIRLIYINYWEDVTPELIRNKVENVDAQPMETGKIELYNT